MGVRTYAIMVNLAIDRNATVAEAAGFGLAATGSAKREPGDPFNEAVGGGLAAARALRGLAQKLEEEAAELIAEACENCESE